jgi:TonB family protein
MSNGMPVASTANISVEFPSPRSSERMKTTESNSTLVGTYTGPVAESKTEPNTAPKTNKSEKLTLTVLGSADSGDQIGPRTVEGNSSSNAMPTSDGGRTISGGVLNGKAISLPKPSYPAAARAVRASGAVQIQVLIDEDGTVFAAAAAGGHPLLQYASVTAACNAKFSPTLLMGQPVKVSGIITYNFVP